MTDNTQPEALRLADLLEAMSGEASVNRCAALLRSQHARIAELEQEVAHTDSLLGKANALARIRAHHIAELEAQLSSAGFTAADMATAEARGFRDGVASVAASAPSAHIKEPYTLTEIKAKIASNDYSAELLLQHAMALLDGASLAANAGEPVAWMDDDGDIEHNHKPWMSDVWKPLYLAAPPTAHPERWEVRALYTHPSPPEGMVREWISVQDELPKCSKKPESFGVEVLIWPPHEDGSRTAFYGRRQSREPNFYKYGALLGHVEFWRYPPPPPTSAEGVEHG